MPKKKVERQSTGAKERKVFADLLPDALERAFEKLEQYWHAGPLVKYSFTMDYRLSGEPRLTVFMGWFKPKDDEEEVLFTCEEAWRATR